MICKIEGLLETMGEGSARVRVEGGLTYEVLLPAFAAARLGGSLDQVVTLYTVHYLEGSAQGNSFVPRLAGFIAEVDRDFYQLMTSVKGIGPRKALRAMSLPPAQIASAIADRDVKTLQSLPEIGKRMAETIVATLHGRVDKLLDGAAAARSQSTPGQPEAVGAGSSSSPSRAALEILLQLGENRSQAVQWIDQILIKRPELDDPQELITEVFRLKSSL
ncbi:MAG: Holliday junction branch migration protein RuvA [Phycisphaeraceae bacterium]